MYIGQVLSIVTVPHRSHCCEPICSRSRQPQPAGRPATAPDPVAGSLTSSSVATRTYDPHLASSIAFFHDCGAECHRWRRAGGRARTLVRPVDNHRQTTALPNEGCALQPGFASSNGSNATMTSVCAGHRPGGAPAGIEPATPSLLWNHQIRLCGPSFSQVAPHRWGAKVIGSLPAKLWVQFRLVRIAHSRTSGD